MDWLLTWLTKFDSIADQNNLTKIFMGGHELQLDDRSVEEISADLKVWFAGVISSIEIPGGADETYVAELAEIHAIARGEINAQIDAIMRKVNEVKKKASEVGTKMRERELKRKTVKDFLDDLDRMNVLGGRYLELLGNNPVVTDFNEVMRIIDMAEVRVDTILAEKSGYCCLRDDVGDQLDVDSRLFSGIFSIYDGLFAKFSGHPILKKVIVRRVLQVVFKTIDILSSTGANDFSRLVGDLLAKFDLPADTSEADFVHFLRMRSVEQTS